MPEPTVNLLLGNWSLTVHPKESFFGRLPECPSIPGNYVARRHRQNYVGQSVDVFRRVHGHFKASICETAIIIVGTVSQPDEQLRKNIEFGLMLVYLACDQTLISKQTDLPAGSADTKQQALDFFQTMSLHFYKAAPHILGSRSKRNREALERVLVYLELIWGEG